VLLTFDDVSLAFGSRPLLDHVSLQVREGERVCIVGRNGEGKSSLLRLVSGAAPPDEGTVWVKPGARVAFLAQDLDAVADQRVEDLVASGLPATLESWERQWRIDTVLSRLGLDGDARFESLSGGWRRRALLGSALAAEPDILLLDEPTNHLDIEAIEWLENFMLEYAGALLFVSHDRAFVNRLATRVVELDRGQLSSWPGNYDAFVIKKAQQLAAEAQQSALFDKKLALEEVWIRKGVEARRTRNEGRVRALYALREERRQRRERIGQVDLKVQDTAESGKVVFDAEHVGIRFGERVILRDFTARIMRGDRIGIVGPNGVGKSTLIRLLLGEIEPDSGRIKRGSRLEVAYYDQQREQLDLSASLMDNVTDRTDYVNVNGENRHVTGYLRDFLFRPEQLKTPASALSGGERNRLMLARLFARPANLLVLDEPTNDLDIDTLELLEELVAGFAGTLLLVSHDRAFLDDVVTSLLVFEGEGRVLDFVGGYSDYARYRAQSAAAALKTASVARKSAAAPSAAPAAAPSAAAASKRKLSFKEQRELDGLPALIEQLESEKAGLEAQVADPVFYSRDRDDVRQKLERLGALPAQIEQTYARWSQLDAATKAV
jgi:ATP-binding cassette subfamily F protein uup